MEIYKPFKPFTPSYVEEYNNKIKVAAEKLLSNPDTCQNYPYAADRARKTLDELKAREELHKWVISHLYSAEVINENEYHIPIKDIIGKGVYKVVESSLIVKKFKENSFVGKDIHLNGSWVCIIQIKTAEFGRSIFWVMEILKNQDKIEELCKIKNECVNLIRID